MSLGFTKSHEWVKVDGGIAEIGISDYAQDALGDIVFISLPEVGDKLSIGGVLAEVESVKAVSEVYSPVSGEVVEVNESLLDDPAAINADSYKAWFAKVKFEKTEDLLTEDEYNALDKSE